MINWRSALLALALVCTTAFALWMVDSSAELAAQPRTPVEEDEELPTPRLKQFDLLSLDGTSVALTDERFGGVDDAKPIAFIFVNPWSTLAGAQLRDVLANAGSFSGELIVICSGDEREVLGCANRFDPEVEGARKALWLRSESEIHGQFGPLFEKDYGIDQLKQVPALLIVDSTRKATHASIGELSTDDVKKALSAEIK